MLAYVEKRVKVLLAGAGAESLKNSEIDSAHALGLLENGTAKNDWAKVRELLRISAGILKPGASEEEFTDEVTRLKDKWAEEAGRIIEPNAALIE